MATLGEDLGGPEVFLMEDSVAEEVCLEVVVTAAGGVLFDLHVVIFSVLEVVEHDHSLLTWLIVDVLLNGTYTLVLVRS